MRTLGFDHIGLATKNPKALADWYIEHLGFTLTMAGPTGNYFIETPDKVMLEIMLPGKGEENVTELTGWKHIAPLPGFLRAVQVIEGSSVRLRDFFPGSGRSFLLSLKQLARIQAGVSGTCRGRPPISRGGRHFRPDR